MTRSSKILLLFLNFTCMAAFRCGEGIDPPKIDLTDQYTGTYARQVDGTDSSTCVPILWRFNAASFSMSYDREHDPVKDSAQIPDDFLLCNWQGVYTIKVGIVSMFPSSEANDSAHTIRTCDGPYAPYGQYQFIKTVNGVITMTSYTENPQGNSVVRTIRLIRKQ